MRKAARSKVGLSSHILHRSYPSGLIVVITKNKKYKSKDGDDDNVKKHGLKMAPMMMICSK